MIGDKGMIRSCTLITKLASSKFRGNLDPSWERERENKISK